jgi:uncharacterized membrane protein
MEKSRIDATVVVGVLFTAILGTLLIAAYTMGGTGEVRHLLRAGCIVALLTTVMRVGFVSLKNTLNAALAVDKENRHYLRGYADGFERRVPEQPSRILHPVN